MSEQKPEQTSGEPGAVDAGPAQPTPAQASGELVSAVQAESTPSVSIMANDEAPALGQPKAEAPKIEVSSTDGSKSDPPVAEASDADAARGNVVVMPPRLTNSDRLGNPEASIDHRATPRRGRFAATAAALVLATVAGALSGALATAGVTRFISAPAVADDTSALEARLQAQVAQIQADISELKSGLDHTSKTGTGQINKTNERIDRLERAQAEPMARLAKLSEAVDKLRAPSSVAPAVVAAAAPAAQKDATGSVASPAGTAALPVPAPSSAAAAPKTEVARLPTVEGWVLRDVVHGGALIESRRGLYEVSAGDPVPGLGRVDAIRRQDGRWVVVTSKGLIVAR